jgi:ubiquinone biosynthesis protein
MTPLRQLPRMLRIAATLVRYRLDDLVEQAHLFRPLRWLRPLLPRPHADVARLPRGARLRLALIELGPIFVKFGQILSTRRDLMPADVADELSQLQDQVPPFPGVEARAAVEAALGAPVAALYASFDETPLASASIAQVHAARLFADSPVSSPSGLADHLPPQAEQGKAGRVGAADFPPSGPSGHLPPQAEEGKWRRPAAARAPPSGPADHLPPQAEEGKWRRPAAARAMGGREVVVKVLRPGIHARIAADVELLRALAELAQRWHPAADKIRPREIVTEIETTLQNELDLQREGANASLLRRNFTAGNDMIVPEVFWSHSKESVLTLERVRGIAVDDLAAIDAAGIDRVALAEKGVRLFYTQVFRDNFFHADAHPGNIWVDPSRRTDPRFIALDFGIMGSLAERDQFWLAENFMALFERDYKRIAELHVAAGWMPAHVRLDELEGAIRTVCEPYFTRPLSEISLAEVVIKLFSVARRYELTLQPQLILLQKTLLNIEGIGRLLHPQIDIWATAKPVLADILRKRYGLRPTLRELRVRLPSWLAAAPEMPELVRTYLKKAAAGDFDAARGAEMQAATAALARGTARSRILGMAGAALLVAAALLYAIDAHTLHVFHVPLSALLAAFASAGAFVAAWRGMR